MLLVNPISTLPALGLERLDGVPGLLHRAGHEAANRVLLPAHLFHDLGQGGSVLALEHGNHLSGLAALADGASRLFLALGHALRAAGAPLGDRAPRLALRSAFGFSG